MSWEQMLESGQAEVYSRVLEAAKREQVSFALGGAFALAHYTGHLRNTKDIDLYVVPEDRDRMVDILGSLKIADLFEKEPYDRSWIYRGYLDDTIVDIIWAFPNKVTQVDKHWLKGPTTTVGGHTVKVVPAEELVWAKIFVLQRQRCDWPDLLNILEAKFETMDWEHLLSRLKEHRELLYSLLTLFLWLRPEKRRFLPRALQNILPVEHNIDQRKKLGEFNRIALLDSRPWFYHEGKPC